MSKADRHHMFFGLKGAQAEQKNTLRADIIYVVRSAVKLFVSFFLSFLLAMLLE